MSEEPIVMTVEFDDGIENEDFDDTRIYRAAFASRDGQEINAFEGYICEGVMTEDQLQVLKDYYWELMIELDGGRTMWRNLEKEMVEYTASVLDLEVILYKHSLLFLVD